ncbi:MAG TPA: mechanosensitive ion channel family protein [Bacteroidota bacterium]|nr:mechanosensitive ion channel family protein [Bacteroidota bacterium]
MLQDSLIKHGLYAVLIVVAALILGRGVRTVIRFILRRHGDDSSREPLCRILRAIDSKLFLIALTVGISLAVREFRKAALPGDETLHEVLDYLSTGTFILAVLLVSHLLSRFFRSSVAWYADEVSRKNRNNLAPTVVPFASKLINIVIFFIVGMIILDHLGVNIGGFLVSLGVGSLAVALAAQETIANMIAWFVILVDQPIRIGDKIRLPSGEEGDVAEIGLRSTRIINYDNNLVVIPNSELVKNRLTNLTLPDASTRVLIEIPVAYGTDIAKARSVVLGVAASRPDLAVSPAPNVYTLNLGEGAIQLRLHARTPDIGRKFDIETELREQIYSALRAAGIEFPRIQRFIHQDLRGS